MTSFLEVMCRHRCITHCHYKALVVCLHCTLADIWTFDEKFISWCFCQTFHNSSEISPHKASKFDILWMKFVQTKTLQSTWLLSQQVLDFSWRSKITWFHALGFTESISFLVPVPINFLPPTHDLFGTFFSEKSFHLKREHESRLCSHTSGSRNLL